MDICINLFKFYDLGSSITRSDIINKINEMELKSGRLKNYQFDTERGEPDYIKYPEPISFIITKELKKSGKEIDIECKVFSYGGLSVKTKIDPEVDDIDNLCSFMDKREFSREIEENFDQLYDEFFYKFTGELKQEYRSKKFFTNLYPVYCISDTGYNDVAELIQENKKDITALLTGVDREKDLSGEQINKVMEYNSRFYKSDYSIIHWNGAFAVDNDADYKDLLFIIELANIQFVKLRAYDDYIDNYLSEYLGLIKKRYTKGLKIFKPGSHIISDITKMRVELEQITDIMDNFEKFFGKWYMAKIYYLASASFEIPRWKRLIESRLDTVDELYTMIHDEKNRKKMLFLNFLTLLLFILWFVVG